VLAVLFFRSFYGSSEPGTPPHHDSIPSNPVRPHIERLVGYYSSILPLPVYNRSMRIRGITIRRLLLPALLLGVLALQAAPMTKLNIQIKTQAGRPVDRASVIVRFVEGHSVVKLGKAIRTTFELRTNQDGEAHVPEIPQGKIQIQVIAKGYQTFGQVFDITEEEKTIPITLNPPQQQYTAH